MREDQGMEVRVGDPACPVGRQMELMKYLAEDCRQGLVYVCLRAGEARFYVMVPMGNWMVPVKGASGATPLEALEKAAERWRLRSPEAPFV